MDLIKKYEKRLYKSKFRMLNHLMIKNPQKLSKQLQSLYHKSYSHQIKKWPITPTSKILTILSKIPEINTLQIADIGCGIPQISLVYKNTINLDKYPINKEIKKADINSLPLNNNQLDIAIYALSLMKINVFFALKEANRVLKKNGKLIIAESMTRFENKDFFIKNVEKVGFELENFEDDKYFGIFVFKKIKDIENDFYVEILLKDCVYKTR